MPGWVCSAGGTLLIPSGGEGNHLFVILNNPADFAGYQPQSCVSVSICSIRKGPYDGTRILKPGVHPFIVQDSYVAYRHARVDSAEHLGELVKNLVFVPLNPIDPATLASLVSGLFASPQTPNHLKKLLPP